MVRDLAKRLNARSNDALNVSVGRSLFGGRFAVESGELAGPGLVVVDHPLVDLERVDLETLVLLEELGENLGDDDLEILLTRVTSTPHQSRAKWV